MKIPHKLLLIFATALILRLSLLFVAYHGDLNNNISWGTIAYEQGLNGFYGSPEAENWPYSAPNQPPLTILMYAGVRGIWQLVENTSWWFNTNLKFFPSAFIWFWEGKGMILLVKMPSILADLGIGYLIYKYLKDKNKVDLGIKLSAIWLFNPIVWYNSAIWGQTDGIVNLLGLISIFALLQKKLSRFGLFFTLSILFKGSLAIITPILFLVALHQKHSLKKWFFSILYSLFAILLISFWFHPYLDLPIWLINLYKDRILPGEIGYLTANAFNFWWLVNPGKVYDSATYLGLPARLWGFVITLTSLSGIIIWLKKGVSDKKLFFSLIMASLVTFLFLTRIHERYLYPFFPSATILLGFIPELWLPYIFLSLTHLLNLYNLFWAPSFQPLEALLRSSVLIQALSVINIATLIYLLRHLRTSKL
jgi:dolichyl-phosphate-mannose-protein mannosyltransferase